MNIHAKCSMFFVVCIITISVFHFLKIIQPLLYAINRVKTLASLLLKSKFQSQVGNEYVFSMVKRLSKYYLDKEIREYA